MQVKYSLSFDRIPPKPIQFCENPCDFPFHIISPIEQQD